MVENEAPRHQDYIAVAGSTEFEDDDTALEALVQLKELTFGDTFNDRETSIDSEESDGISILFYHTEENNRLRVYTTEGGHVHITCRLEEDFALNAQDILETIADEIGGMEISHASAVRFLELAFDSLDFPIQPSTSHKVTGIRITEPEANYITQATEQKGVSFVSRDRRFDEGRDLTEITPLGAADWEAINDFVDKFD